MYFQSLEGKKANLLWKNYIIKTVGISQIFYMASCIQVPEYVIKEVNKMLFKFLSGSGKEKIKRKTMVKDMCDGSLLMTDIESQIYKCLEN